MIGRDEIATACREADTETERAGFTAYFTKRQIDQDGLLYVARQRAMRCVYVLAGRPVPRAYQPFDVDEEKANDLMLGWMDGFAAGLAVRGDEIRPITTPDGGHRSNRHDSS